MSDTEFEGGDDGHGHGDCTFLVKQAQPSHMRNPLRVDRPPKGLNRARYLTRSEPKCGRGIVRAISYRKCMHRKSALYGA